MLKSTIEMIDIFIDEGDELNRLVDKDFWGVRELSCYDVASHLSSIINRVASHLSSIINRQNDLARLLKEMQDETVTNSVKEN